MFPLAQHTIFLALAGSHAHGTARDGSDVDLRGVCVAPLEVRLSFHQYFEQYEGLVPESLAVRVLPRLSARAPLARALTVKTECVIFDLAKFVKLCAAQNPNTLEILFTDEEDWLLQTQPWRRLYDQRHRFLSKAVQQTFLGYAMAQLKQIKTHRSWLLNPPANKPSREAFGLPVAAGTLSPDDQNRIEQSIAEKIRSYGVDDIDMPKPIRVAVQERLAAFYRDVLDADELDLSDRMRAVATHALQLPDDVVAVLNSEKKYRAAMKHWEAYQTWKRQRNPARAELERRYGYDTKHAMHLVRLMRMGVEVLETGELRVRRADAEELVAIRSGALSFDELMEHAEAIRSALDRAEQTSVLPDSIDDAFVDALVLELATEGR